MKPEIKAKWVAALRSGEYKQGHGALRYEDSFCCLGVLCDLAAREGVGAWREDGTFATSDDSFDVSASLPPKAVGQWAGLMDPNPHVTLGVSRNALSGLNDNGDTFAVIADLIEAHL